MTTELPPAGWYPDPSGKPGQTYWDGEGSHTPGPADRPPPDARTPPRQPWWRRQAIVIPAALLTVAVIAAAIVITSQRQENSNGPQITYGPQVTLPFTGLSAPNGVAVDSAGNLYVADGLNGQVVKLPAGSSAQVELPFTGLKASGVGGRGALFLSCLDHGVRVTSLADLPYTRVRWRAAVSVGGSGGGVGGRGVVDPIDRRGWGSWGGA